jgi:hypothetical protein
MHAAMLTVPLDVGFYPENWKQAVGVMLERIPGTAHSKKLRIMK